LCDPLFDLKLALHCQSATQLFSKQPGRNWNWQQITALHLSFHVLCMCICVCAEISTGVRWGH